MEADAIIVQQVTRSSIRAWIPRHVVSDETHKIGASAIAALSVWGNYDNMNATHYSYEFSDELSIHGVIYAIKKLFNLRTSLCHDSTETTIIERIDPECLK